MTELEHWDNRIIEIVQKLGLDCFEQEFIILNHNQMIGFMAYGGLPSRYSHWSFGKAFEKTKTLYSYGVTGLPYEMVINTDPCLAYLMKDNSLCLQVLTMAHVYGHNNFFKTNTYFQNSPVKAQDALEMFKNHARFINNLQEDPSLDYELVEQTIDHAHTLRFHVTNNFSIRADESQEKNLYGYPLEECLLSYIAKKSKTLTNWQRDILEIVEKESVYFVPQIETKIMNEGWASLIHYVILHQLQLPLHMHMEFLINHAQVLRPVFGGINPYHIGFNLLVKIYESQGGTFDPIAVSADDPAFQALKQVIAVDRDSSFLRRFLTPQIAEELYLFEHDKKGKHRVVTRLPVDDEFFKLRETLIKQTGMLSIPKLIVKEHLVQSNTLIVQHVWDGRELQIEWAEHSLKSIRWLWGGDVVLETRLNEKPVNLRCLEKEVRIEKAHTG